MPGIGIRVWYLRLFDLDHSRASDFPAQNKAGVVETGFHMLGGKEQAVPDRHTGVRTGHVFRKGHTMETSYGKMDTEEH